MQYPDWLDYSFQSLLGLRLCQRATKSAYSRAPVLTPPSRKAHFSVGNRCFTPPKNKALHNASPASAKWPIWLYIYVEVEVRPPQPMPLEWNVGATCNSTHLAQTGSYSYALSRQKVSSQYEYRAASEEIRWAAGIGRTTCPANITVFIPSVPTAWSSSAIASCGVCIE